LESVKEKVRDSFMRAVMLVKFTGTIRKTLASRRVSLKNIQAITFDFWGTLYSSARSNNSNRTKVLQRALAEAGLVAISQEKLDASIKITWGEWVRVWETEHRTWGAGEWLDSMQNLLQFQLPDELHCKVLQELEDVVLDGNTQLIDGVSEMIPVLAKQYRLGIISDTGVSSGKTLSKLVERDGLLKYFTSLVFSDELGSSKPAAQPFQTALAELSAQPRQAVHVGDLRRTDVAGANNAGMWSIRFTGYQDDPRMEFGEASIVLANYANISAALEQLETLSEQKGSV
jgi:putative hydrolase of the HAD superfamily